MDKIYDHNQTESKWYSLWEGNHYFQPQVDENLPTGRQGKKPFTIIMPPPNANGELHVGHATFIAIEDILVRYHRMKGEPTLWLPGADHAGILTQVVYERELEKKGKSRFDLGRDEFFKQTYEFTMKNKKHMEDQLKALGASCDWSREKFTLDPQISKAVYTTFKNLYDDGLIYKGERLINWCHRCGTALSDLEVEHEERRGRLWYIKYPIKNSKLKTKNSKFITVATTRPETMLGDTAVAVNPTDKRYKELVGKTVTLPLMGREIPIIADSLVDSEFGTGVVKVTPAHDSTDFEIGQRNSLEIISVIGPDGKMSDAAGEFSGQKIPVARENILKNLDRQRLIERVEAHKHSVGICERCRSTIEPLVSKQWFVKIKPLAEPAIEAVEMGKIKILPKRFEKTYFNWMENIRDWCISRQIWWGHRLPVYYCQEIRSSECRTKNGVFVSVETPKQCPFCRSEKFEQDPDTLDTWFSSGQWPFTTLGWPYHQQSVNRDRGSAKTSDFEYFYPTSVMETGYDILFFWVARMIMLGIYSTGKPPFHTVFLHGLVRDEHGQKMSKSRGNVIDPLDVADKYGADAVRTALVFGTSPGNDINLGESKIRGMRNFTNKVWNIGRYVIDMKPEALKTSKPTKEDKQILEQLNKTKKKVSEDIEKYRFGQAAEELYEFIWHKFADKYIEHSKTRREEAQPILEEVFEEFLRLLHPFMPFITEELWQKLPNKKGVSIMVSSWPN
ncbi:MAG: valine--tRNA ligase [Candidatus Woykebacteria bacterium RBG_16_43_9]|uniref:Valine--tRNA ligase n=1 Tax=Candidatus Woykebacteria bacterium RBG_16_43_9 TaxID=1802596 RepID=A0A1G1WCX5_9BACT|nr:MAG: valine--tRNA ligase [Candidatus Woykebacteria bacterium RBG_16_43_9]